MKSLLKVGLFAFAFGLFATACNNPGAGNQNNADSIPAVEEEAPMTAPEETAPATTDSVAAPIDSAADTSGM